jgi:hypothetical protein
MEGLYAVRYKEKVIGQVLLQRQGLYYSIECQCAIPDERVYALKLETKGKYMDLGILYPAKNSQFGMITKIPAKRLEQGSLEFSIQCRNKYEDIFPIDRPLPTKVIVNIDQLRLCRRNGKDCLVLNCEKNS